MNSLGCLGGPGFFGSGRVRVGHAMVWAGLKNLRPGPAHCEACPYLPKNPNVARELGVFWDSSGPIVNTQDTFREYLHEPHHRDVSKTQISPTRSGDKREHIWKDCVL